LIFVGCIISVKKIGLEAQALLLATRQGIKPVRCRLQNKSIYHTILLTKQNLNSEVKKWVHGSEKDKKQKGG
jgi:hypothetical protein